MSKPSLAAYLAADKMLSDIESESAARAERELAYAAVNAALRQYRWWGLQNILNTVRMYWQQFKFKRALNKWFKRYPDGCLNMSDEGIREADRYAKKLGL